MKKITITNTDNKYVFLYLRVSTKRQAVLGYSLEGQLKACKEYAKKLELTVKDIFVEEGESGTIAERTEFQKMLNRCEDGEVGGIIVINTDRFARSEIDHFLIKDKLKKLGIRLYSALQPMVGEETPESYLIDTVMAGVNAFYSRDNSRKTIKGMREKFEQGTWPTKAPLGYLNVKDEITEKRTIGLNPDQDYLVKEAFEEFAKGKYSIHSLCQRMAQRGLKGKTGVPIGVSTLHVLLTNTFYYGLMRWGGMEKMGTHTKLITEELFNKVKYLLSKHRSFVIRDRKHDFLLRGAIICSKHNRRLVGEWHKVNSVKRDKIGYYHCAERGGCKGTYTEIDKLEGLVANQFKKLHFTDEFMNEVVNQAKLYLGNIQNSFRSRKQGLDNKLKALDEKRTNVEHLLAEKTYTREVYQRVHGKIEEDIAVLYKQIADLEKDRQVDVRFIEEIFSLARDIYGTYLASPNQLKRGYIKLFFEHLYVANKRIAKVTYNPLFATLLKEQKIMLAQKAKETIVASVVKSKPNTTQDVLNIPANQVILSQVKLRDQDSNLEP